MRPAVEESIAALQRWEDAMTNLFLVAQICSLDDQTSSFMLTCMAAWWWIIRAFVFDCLVHIYQSLKFDAVCVLCCAGRRMRWQPSVRSSRRLWHSTESEQLSMSAVHDY